MKEPSHSINVLQRERELLVGQLGQLRELDKSLQKGIDSTQLLMEEYNQRIDDIDLTIHRLSIKGENSDG